jgi:inositol phosphorylceramide mannosyltransferase catalytic subunit
MKPTSKWRFNRPIVRLLKFALLIASIYTLYGLWNRYQYEQLLNRLYITFDDFEPDYAEALSNFPDHTDIDAYDYSSYPSADPKDNISPIVHFIWYHDLYESRPEISNMPSEGSHCPGMCERNNPDFEVKVWNATAGRDLLEQHYSWFLPTYDNYAHPIQRVDAAKYFILYHYGGFYLDMDVSCRRSFKPLQRFPAWIPRASPQGLNNDAMAARPGHPAWKRMIEMLAARDRNLVFPYLTIFWSTGPQFATDMIKQFFDANPALTEYVPGTSKTDTDPDAVFVLPEEFYAERFTFFGHSPGGTWHEGDVAVVLWLVARPWMVVMIAILFTTLVLGIIYFALRLRRNDTILPFKWSKYSAIDR